MVRREESETISEGGVVRREVDQKIRKEGTGRLLIRKGKGEEAHQRMLKGALSERVPRPGGGPRLYLRQKKASGEEELQHVGLPLIRGISKIPAIGGGIQSVNHHQKERTRGRIQGQDESLEDLIYKIKKKGNPNWSHNRPQDLERARIFRMRPSTWGRFMGGRRGCQEGGVRHDE